MLALLFAFSCADPGVPVPEQVVPAACGSCVFEMKDHQGCFWAVEIDGAFHAVGGEVPPVDMIEAHQPGGMCATERQARVAGSIRPDGRFLATKFELLPWDGTGEAAHEHQH
ncbi:MAG: DUF6370 family protein [Myxococcota bacterium]